MHYFKKEKNLGSIRRERARMTFASEDIQLKWCANCEFGMLSLVCKNMCN